MKCRDKQVGGKVKDNKKLKILIVAIAIAISSIFIYKGAISPRLYDKYLNTGIKYLMDGEYEEAILAFDKAIKIESKTTEARVYQAEAYIGNEEIDNAVNVLEEAQNIDKTNEELLKEILDILIEIDGDIAYEFLDRFIQTIGKENISEEIKNLIESAYDTPEPIRVEPESGTYVSDISVKLKKDQLKIGHSYYYTLDGSEPNKKSEKYRGKIDVSKSSTIKIKEYNKNDESTYVITLEYIIDKEIISQVKNSISESEKLIKDTIVGTEIGNISKAESNKLKNIVNEANKLIENESVTYDEARITQIKIKNAMDEFKNNIIKPTDKSRLKQVISEADRLYNNSTEGNNEGQYKLGSKDKLLKSISKAKDINSSNSVKQDEIDNIIYELNKEIDIFKSNKIKKEQFTYDMALRYIVNKYGPAPSGYTYIAKDMSIKNGLKYCYVLFGEERPTGALHTYEVYENGNIVEVEMYH